MTTTWWPSVYPAELDTFSPALIDNIDEVIVDHPNTLAAAIIALQGRLNITNGVATGFGGVSFYTTGHPTNPGAAGDPTLWVDSTTAPNMRLMYTDELGTDYDITLGGGDLDFAYDFGGAGAGRSITADTGAVEITVPDTSGNIGLVVNQNDITNNPDGLLVSNAGTGYAIKLSGLSNTIQGDDSVGLYCDSILTDSVLSLISTIPLGSANNAVTYLNSINSGTGDSTVLIAALGSGGTDLVSIISGSGDITLQANSSLAIPFNDLADADLDATFSSSSIVGALNELKSGSEVALTFSTGLTRLVDTITADLSTGIAGGQSVIGGTAAGNSLTLSSTTNATKGNIIVDNATVIPTTNDGAALGTGSNSFSDLFLASGGVINWGNGVSLLTHSAGALTVGGSVATTLIAPTVSGSATTANNLTLRANTADLTTGQVNVTSSLEATSTSAAALTSAGGLGVAKRIWSTDLTVTNLPTLGGTQLTTTVARLNYLTNSAGTTGTNSTNIVFSTSPVLTTPTITTSINPSVNDGATLGASGTAFSDLFLASGGVINWNAGASTITHSANTLTIGGSGATTLALGTNSLTLTGSIGSTGSRVLKGWFTDLEVTNAIAGSITGNAATVTIGNEASDTTCFPLFSTAATGSLSPKTNANLTYNSSTSLFTSTLLAATNKITLGAAGGTTGSAEFKGTTSGTVTVKSADVAGTWTLTLPSAVGPGVLFSDSSGVTSWVALPDSEDGMTVYKNIYDDFTADYASASTIEVWGLPFNINAVQIRKITRKPTGSAVSVVRSRGTDLICTWTPHATIQGRGTISTTSLGTCAATDEYIIEIEGPPKGYNAETDSNKVREINPFHYINDGLVLNVASSTAQIVKPLGKDNYNAISLNVSFGAGTPSVIIYGSNDPLGVSGFHDITDLACGVPVIDESGAYQTISVIAFEYIKISLSSTGGTSTVYLTRFLKN